MLASAIKKEVSYFILSSHLNGSKLENTFSEGFGSNNSNQLNLKMGWV